MAAAAHAIVLNGAHGEGGSALLRTALAMSVLTQQPLRIHGVRGATRKPGLTSEDLSFVRTLAKLTSAEISGDQSGGADLRFDPKHQVRGLTFDVDTQAHDAGMQPGHASVIASSLAPILSRSGAYSEFTVYGETHSANALSIDSFELSTCYVFRKQGLFVQPALVQAGYGFSSRGELRVEIEPAAPEPIEWHNRGELKEIICRISLTDLSEGIAQRGATFARRFANDLSLPLKLETARPDAQDPGAFISVAAQFDQGAASMNAIGAKGVRIESLIKRCFEDLRGWLKSEATVDPFLADQILIPAVLSSGRSVFRTSAITRRLITMAWVIKQFIPMPITVIGREGEPGTITVGS